MTDVQPLFTPRKGIQLLAQLERAKDSSRLRILAELDDNIDYTKRTCSILRLREMMDMFRVDHKKLGQKPRKDVVVKHYREFAAPLIDHLILHPQLYSSSPSVRRTPSLTQTSGTDVAMNPPSTPTAEASASNPLFFKTTSAPSNSTPTSSTDHLETLSHGSKKSKVSEIREGLKKSVDKMVSRGFNKSALVKLREHVTNIRNNGKRPSIEPGNIRRPHILSPEEIKTKDRDTIRQALQILCPQVWIPTSVAVSRPMLVALYNLFLCDVEDPDLCQGVHFEIIPLKEINFDGYISF
ncbi:hypothetical protein DFH28DRAFT_888306 [Melampsora americana]|nr:hypothetical protein DFH28DRAFT_907184 [Melampsora americana]KAH9818410.1 hypothetical protein DFH28DRAFT_888306 [Melampsora americana]